jgi:hypothetical protein
MFCANRCANRVARTANFIALVLVITNRRYDCPVSLSIMLLLVIVFVMKSYFGVGQQYFLKIGAGNGANHELATNCHASVRLSDAQ